MPKLIIKIMSQILGNNKGNMICLHLLLMMSNNNTNRINHSNKMKRLTNTCNKLKMIKSREQNKADKVDSQLKEEGKVEQNLKGGTELQQ